MTQHFDESAARHRLEADRDRVQGLIEGLEGEGLDVEAADQVGDVSHVTDPADQGSETFEREKDIAILEQLDRDLAEIEAALQRLDEGTYGIDEVTGDPIAAERLDAYPVARTNIDRPGVVTVTLRLFAAAREAAGRGHDDFEPARVPTVGALLDAATARYGPRFGEVVDCSRVWVNGDEPADGQSTTLADGDEVAVLPPVSGG